MPKFKIIAVQTRKLSALARKSALCLAKLAGAAYRFGRRFWFEVSAGYEESPFPYLAATRRAACVYFFRASFPLMPA